jgi:hypothetical protein
MPREDYRKTAYQMARHAADLSSESINRASFDALVDYYHNCLLSAFKEGQIEQLEYDLARIQSAISTDRDGDK